MTTIGEPGFSRTKRFDNTERLSAIHNAKQRSIGVDKDALDAQVAAAKDKASTEKSIDGYYEGMASYFDAKMVMMEQERIAIKQQMAKDLVDYRKATQGKMTTKEFDLNDPAVLKNSLPARVGDEDPRNGVSSLQKFEGEDLTCGERKKLQQAQQAAWCQAQMSEKEAKAQYELKADAEMAALLRSQETFQNDVARGLSGARQENTVKTAATNLALAASKKEKEAAAAAAEKEANEAEQAFIMSEPHMMEHPALSVSALNPYTRVRKDHWKGMNEAQVAEVLETQALQRKLHAERQARDQETDAMYVASQDYLYKTLEMKAEEVEELKKQKRLETQAAIKAQMAEKAARDSTLKTVYGSNVPSADFFAQFGTSAR
eukprot:CAMPEP_0170143888 /NCGR_PEP_ID=MMETSP0033_2-20121228/13188_1 /TAXON_ID=195969 /ORGANISM="Dolichomastix tenuilepis, Strain CCMP3274" /LENGTH=374 /DNA_ID=CAMNT_0010380359 /DNA_START=30 /DNA_END=1154 /DNA_ORIENTATION=+